VPSAVLFMWTTACDIFVPTVQLTDRGERHIDAIIAIVFQYIHMLKQSPPPRQLAPQLLEEKKKLISPRANFSVPQHYVWFKQRLANLFLALLLENLVNFRMEYFVKSFVIPKYW
jgi:secreted Zn-dependent insulinase-like peptidase